jgi:hypothetical protein
MKYLLFILSLFFCSLTFVQSQNLLSSTFLEARTLGQMQSDFGPLMQHGIEMYKILYETPDINGQTDTASGLMVLPIREGDFDFPLLCYQHGTVSSRSDVPSELRGGYELAAVFGGLGYISSAADFLGLGTSRGFHPYVHADSEASASIDMMRAVRDYCEENEFGINDQVFITGYSQGGHAAAAVHREIQNNHSEEFDIIASAPMSGPYSISGEMRGVILSDEAYSFPAYLANTALSYNYVYGLFEEVEDYFAPPYAAPIKAFYEEEITLTTLNTTLQALLTQNEGASVTRFMLQDSMLNYLTNDLDHPINLRLAENDVYDWTPEVPTRLFYCMADDQVIFTNSLVADSVMNLNGASDVEAIDINSDFDHNQCVEPAVIQTAFFFAQYQEVIASSPSVEIPREEIQIFPNPASRQLNITHSFDAVRVELIDMTGKIAVAQQLTPSKGVIHLEALPRGLYAIKVTTQSGYWMDKLIIH